MKYRKKPVVIEAFRFQIDKAMPDWFNEKRITNEIVTHDDGTVEIKTLEGMMKANKGDYIIQGVNGEIYPCKPDIFEKTYDEVVSEMTPLIDIKISLHNIISQIKSVDDNVLPHSEKREITDKLYEVENILAFNLACNEEKLEKELLDKEEKENERSY